jgi:HTH-type transcriptional regulator/antitoxin HigA
MDMKIIKNEAEYEAALFRIEGLMDVSPDSPEEGELELLALLVEKYEGERYPIDLGSQSKVSEVLNYKRPLSLTMIRALNRGLGIPAEVLLQDTGQNAEGDIDYGLARAPV